MAGVAARLVPGVKYSLLSTESRIVETDDSEVRFCEIGLVRADWRCGPVFINFAGDNSSSESSLSSSESWIETAEDFVTDAAGVVFFNDEDRRAAERL